MALFSFTYINKRVMLNHTQKEKNKFVLRTHKKLHKCQVNKTSLKCIFTLKI